MLYLIKLFHVLCLAEYRNTSAAPGAAASAAAAVIWAPAVSTAALESSPNI